MEQDETKQAQPEDATPHKIRIAGSKISLRFKFAFILGILSLLVYADSLKNGFVLDDPGVITQNSIVTKGVSGIPELLSTPYRKGSPINSVSNDLYRPLSLVVFAIEYEFSGNNPFPYHLFNILLYAGCVILLFLFLDTLFERKKTVVAFIAALLFAMHPIHTEVVANIKSADELLCFFFAFLGLIVFANYMKSEKTTQLMLGAFCFLLSLLSKETVITFLAVIPLVFFFYIPGARKRSTMITISTVAMIVICLVVRISVLSAWQANNMGNIAFTDNPLVSPGLSFESRMATAVFCLGYYVKLLFLPYPLVCDYTYNTISLTHFSDPKVIASLLLFLFLIAFSLQRFMKNRKDPYAFAFFYFLMTISLFSNIPFLIRSTLAERFMFFPSVGFCLAMALLLERLAGRSAGAGFTFFKNEKILLTLVPVLIFYSAITVDRKKDWLDNLTLYSADVKKAPNSSHLNFLMGVELKGPVADNETDPMKKRQMTEEGIKYLRRSIEIYPDYWASQLEIAHAFIKLNQFDSVASHAAKAIQLDPANIDAINILGGIYCVNKKYFEAIELYKKAIALNPNYVLPIANTGLCYGYLGKYDSAIFYASRAISVDPSYNASYEYLATIYKITGNTDSSAKYEMKARGNNPAFRAKTQLN